MKNKNVENVNSNVYKGVKRQHNNEPCLEQKRIKNTHCITKREYVQDFVDYKIITNNKIYWVK